MSLAISNPIQEGLSHQECRPVTNKLSPFKGLTIRIPIIIPIKGRGFINQGSGLRRQAELPEGDLFAIGRAVSLQTEDMGLVPAKKKMAYTI